jgi:hypothetical protein
VAQGVAAQITPLDSNLCTAEREANADGNGNGRGNGDLLMEIPLDLLMEILRDLLMTYQKSTWWHKDE